jgi:hypothetical protein
MHLRWRAELLTRVRVGLVFSFCFPSFEFELN